MKQSVPAPMSPVSARVFAASAGLIIGSLASYRDACSPLMRSAFMIVLSLTLFVATSKS